MKNGIIKKVLKSPRSNLKNEKEKKTENVIFILKKTKLA